MSETPPEAGPPFFLRDRLLATLTEYEVKQPMEAVEAVCDQFVAYLRAQVVLFREISAADKDLFYGPAVATMLTGVADGIDAGKPPVSTQDPGVPSDS